MDNLDYALEYLGKGLSLIPLFSPTILNNNPPPEFTTNLQKVLEKNAKEQNPLPKEKVIQKLITESSKRPLISKWGEYQNRRPTEEEVKKWFTDFPSANIGIVTGKVSNIVVFDFDSGGSLEYAKAHGGFPDAPIVETGKPLPHRVAWSCAPAGQAGIFR
jgi:hypothetical protein